MALIQIRTENMTRRTREEIERGDMTLTSSGNRILVRAIDDENFVALKKLAKKSGRTLEAEARAAIRAHVAPLLIAEEAERRRSGIARRLSDTLKALNERSGEIIKESHVAEAIGEERAGHVYNWFLGTEEPSFPQLKKLSEFLGVDYEWLVHGRHDQRVTT